MAIPYQTLKALTEGQNPAVRSSVGITEKQIQPAGIDLTLGDRAYRIASSFLPRENETVAELLKHRTLYEFELKPGSILETNTPYLIPLRESLALPSGYYGLTSPKSSIGRVDIFVRLVTDRNTQYDHIPAGYNGPLYLEIIPLTFATRIAPNLPMTQLRLRRTDEQFPTSDELQNIHNDEGLLFFK